MFAADTNVLVRLVVSDDLEQQAAAARRLKQIRESGENVDVSVVALAELSWVLDAAYGYPRSRIADAIAAIVNTPPLRAVDRAAVLEALERFRTGPADFSDYLIVALSEDARVLTFDRKLLKHPRGEQP